MKRVLQSCSIVLLLGASAAHAQLYKSVGPDGKVSYSDAPPSASATRVENKPLTIGGVSASDFPFELSEAMKNNPVTLYTTKNCLPCDDGRKLLAQRGVPHTEKTVNTNEDIIQFRQVGGEGSLPLLTVGQAKERGFESGAWNRALSNAGYPESSKLPKNYRTPLAGAAAPLPKPAAAKQDPAAGTETTAAKPAVTALPSAIGNAPPGFRF